MACAAVIGDKNDNTRSSESRYGESGGGARRSRTEKRGDLCGRRNNAEAGDLPRYVVAAAVKAVVHPLLPQQRSARETQEGGNALHVREESGRMKNVDV